MWCVFFFFSLITGPGGRHHLSTPLSTTSSSSPPPSLSAGHAFGMHFPAALKSEYYMHSGGVPGSNGGLPGSHHHHQHGHHGGQPPSHGFNQSQAIGSTTPTSALNSHHQMSYHNMFTPSRDPGTMWRCRSCGKEVTNRWHHYHSHTAQRSMCPYCPATYSRIDTLRSHLRVKHPDRLLKLSSSI